MRVRLVAAVAALTTTTSATAADWWFIDSIGPKGKQVTIFLDADGIVSRGSIKQAWDFRIRETADEEGVRKTKILQSYDCENRTLTLLSWVSYGNNDRFIDSERIPSYQQERNDVVPESVGELVWKYVCEGDTGNSVPVRTQSPEEFSARLFRL